MAPKRRTRRDNGDAEAATEEEAADDPPAPRSTRQRTAGGSGRGTAAVSTSRAEFFARGNNSAPPPPTAAAAGSTTTGRRRGSANAQSSWPGYYATARDLGDAREAAQAARQQALEESQAATEAAPVVQWIPRPRARRALIRTRECLVPTLAALACACLAEHIERLPTLEYIDPEARHAVAREVVRRRKLTPAVLPLFLFAGVTEIDLPDCSNIDETAFLEALQAATSEADGQLQLTILRLGLCGRCISDAVITELGDALRTVERLAVNGCYRLSDAGVEALVRRCAPSLEAFELSCNQRITHKAIDYFGELRHLHSLSLSECPQLDDTALQTLREMRGLRTLALDQMERITDAFVADVTMALPNLEELSLARCSQLSDTAVRAALENCRQLRRLDISDLSALTDDAVEPIRRLGHALRRVAIRRCLGLTDVAIEHIAFGAGAYLEELEMSSVAETTDAAMVALQTHAISSLRVLDMSFCRSISEDRLGIFTDAAEKLESLVLWGCTQITARFLTSHSREELMITGHPLLTGLTVKY